MNKSVQRVLERLISKKPFVVFSFSPVFSSQAPLPPSVDLFGAGGQLSGDGACAKDVIQGFREGNHEGQRIED